MTDEQINRAIAEACDIVGKSGEIYKTPDGWVVDCPNYCTDLNAMAEAEKTLTNVSDAAGYSFLLEDMENMIERWVPYRTLWALSARQRAEAFLRTLGKWEEAK
jgi:hypothetical protein